jgi:hypothetical protein
LVTIDISPALLTTGAAGQTRHVYPGEREQLVDAALRALAVRGSVTTTLNDDAKDRIRRVTIVFSVYEVRKELASMGHTFSHAQVIEALAILANSVIHLTQQIFDSAGPLGNPTEATFCFYSRHMEQGDRRMVVLNEFESEQILCGSYRAFDYSSWMALDGGLARWLYHFIHVEHRGARKRTDPKGTFPFEFSLSGLFDRGVIERTTEIRCSINRIRDVICRMSTDGILAPGPGTISTYTEKIIDRPTGGRREVVDVLWGLWVSDPEIGNIIGWHAEAKYRKQEFAHWSMAERLERTSAARELLICKKPLTGTRKPGLVDRALSRE